MPYPLLSLFYSYKNSTSNNPSFYSLFQQNSNPMGNFPVKIVAAVETVYKKAINLNNEHLLLYNEPLANADFIGIDPGSGWY